MATGPTTGHHLYRFYGPRPSITDGAGTEDRLCGLLGEIVQETRAIPIQGGQVNSYAVPVRHLEPYPADGRSLSHVASIEAGQQDRDRR
ncbi:MAG TPA: hypothetical protein VKC66_13205 [Xanthobacteraceae bacterium]|nr:hypothetical protein [Xanthobacteraceae bacterium]